MTSEQIPQQDARRSAAQPARIDDRVSPDASEVAAANQGKAEPMPSTGDRADEPGSRAADTNETMGEERQQAPRPAAAPLAGAGVRAPGDVSGMNAPAVHAAQGTSEEADPATVALNSTTSLAPPGKPDGEVDTRPR